MKRLKKTQIQLNLEKIDNWEALLAQIASKLKGVKLNEFVEVTIRSYGIEIVEVQDVQS